MVGRVQVSFLTSSSSVSFWCRAKWFSYIYIYAYTYSFSYSFPSWGFPGSSVDKESTCNAGDPGSIPGSGKSAGEGIGYPLQCAWASLVAQLVKNLPAMRETWVRSWVGKIPWRRERLPTPVFWPGEFQGLYSPWGHKQLYRTEQLPLHFHYRLL